MHAVGDREQQLALAMAESHAVDRRILARDVDRLAVDVGRDALCLRPQSQCGEGENPGPGADVGDIAEAGPASPERVQRPETGGSRRMLPGAESEAGVDLEGGRALG